MHLRFFVYQLLWGVVSVAKVCLFDIKKIITTLAIQNGMDIKTVSRTLGHATVACALDKYGYVSERMMGNASKKVQKFIESMRK